MSQNENNNNSIKLSKNNTLEENGQMSDIRPPELEIELELELDTLHYTYLYIIECCEKIFQTEDENLIKLLEQCDLSISNEAEKSFIKKKNYLLLMIYSINEIYQSLDKPFTNKLDYVLLSNLFKKTETKLEINIKELKQDEEYDYKRFLDYYIKSIKNQLKEKKED